MRLCTVVLFFLFGFGICVRAQTLGGAATYQFLKLPPSALQSATGGLNVSMLSTDAASALVNPALLHGDLNGNISTSFLNLFGAGRVLHAAGARNMPEWKAVGGAGITFIDYGAVAQTDAAGNEAGTFRAREYALQASISKAYQQRWRYGASLKVAGTQYGRFSSLGLAADVGLHYSDTANGLRAAVVVRNAGVQLKAYGTGGEELPFELVAGFTKKLEKAPLAFSLTGKYLHRLRITYPDSLTAAGRPSTSLGRELFNHLIVATHVYISPQLQVHAGYNALRAFELRTSNAGSGLNGFSGGIALQLKKLGLQYASAWYNRRATNQITLNVQLSGSTGL